jgi:hypothetical protein
MNGNGNGQDVPMIPIGKVPSLFIVQQVPGPEGPQVLLVVSTPTGQACYVLDPDCAIQTGQNLREAGLARLAGLIVPGP